MRNFKLYDLLFDKMISKKIEVFQNDLLLKHSEEVENMYRQMRTWRHDYHNHIQTLKVHSSLGNLDEIAKYLDKLELDLQEVDTVVKTGNVMVDAILNSKLSLIKSKNIPLTVKAIVPSKMSISDTDLCVIVGNLLDNAMESCLECNNLGYIRIFMGVMKGQLYISVTNSTTFVRKKDKTYLSTKKNVKSTGFGLASIDKIADKYSGFVNRQDEEGVFVTEVFLPLS